MSVADDTDLPVDGNQCTQDVCTSGSPSNPDIASGTACSQNGGSLCDGAGACVECLAASDCPDPGNACVQRTCTSGACGTTPVASGTPITTQTTGDCQVIQCDGNGGTMSVADDTDLPVDGNQCTQDVCTSGTPSNPETSSGTACSQNGGTLCDGAGNCVECLTGSDCTSGVCSTNACQAPTCTDSVKNGNETDVDCGGGTCPPCASGLACSVDTDCQGGVCTGNACTGPVVVSANPADTATGISPTSSIAVEFSAAMNGSTLTAQTASGACSGTIQLSSDGFTTCLAFSSATAALSSGNTVATLQPAPALSYSGVYQVRVTTGAQDAYGDALTAAYTMATGFTTSAAPAVCDGSVVISQVYGAGGNSGATYNADFIELHNRGTTAVDLTGWSVQYASSSGSSWSTASLSGTIAAGGYYLVAMSSGATGAALPAADATGTLSLASSNGKVALVDSTTALTGSCPADASLVDFVGYGTANCYEGPAAAPSPPNSTISVMRGNSGCTDVDDNSNDFTAVAVAPRNGATAAASCSPCGVVNETDIAEEADWCNVQSPTSLSVAASQSSGLIYGRIYEAGGVTGTGSAPVGVIAQVGYGPADVNPETQSGFIFYPTSYNMDYGSNAEYMGSFTVPATPGDYRYVYRFSLDGQSWTYCDLDGAGSNSGLSFDVTQLPVLTVN